MVAMRGERPQTTMLRVWRKTVNRRNRQRFESGTALRRRPKQIAASGGCRHCPPVRSVLKCSSGSARKENGIGGGGRIVGAESLGGRNCCPATAGGARGTGGPAPGCLECVR